MMPSASPVNNRTRIVYIGAERVGLACLERLINLGKNIVGVFTAHDELRSRIADFITFDEVAERSAIPLYKVKSSKDPETARLVRELEPDLLVVISWSQIIPKEILETASLGCVGIHYSLLPSRRGGAPLNWALIEGLTRSGITLLYYDTGVDTGDIIGQKEFEIAEEDTVKTLLDKIIILAPELLAEHIDDIEQGVARRIRQDESLASYTRTRKPADSQIDWSRSVKDLYNFIRALVPPYPPAFTIQGDKKLVICRARLDGAKLWIEGYIE
jgi:methionyl-tRNA formyltransferase